MLDIHGLTDDSEAWRDFLKGEGSLHIIAALGEKPHRFTDLEERIPISSRTLSDELDFYIGEPTADIGLLTHEEMDIFD